MHLVSTSGLYVAEVSKSGRMNFASFVSSLNDAVSAGVIMI
jgi:hypothetical protein